MNNLFLINETFTNGYISNILDIISIFAIFCAISVIVNKNPIWKCGKLLRLWENRLSNSGEALKLIIPSLTLKNLSGWSNYSCKVTIYKIYESIMGDRGSKPKRISLKEFRFKPLNAMKNLFVKEQRVDGSWCDIYSYLRYTLLGFERNHLTRIPSNHINLSRYFSVDTKPTFFKPGLSKNSELNLLNPWFITGFTDGEGTFGLYINNNNSSKSGYKIAYVFAIGLHLKDLTLLQNIQKSLGVGKIYNIREDVIQLRVESLKELIILIQHFENYPLLTQKRIDFELFKSAILLIKNKEHLTELGMEKLLLIKSALNLLRENDLNNSLIEEILSRLPDIKSITIPDPNWLAGFTSAEGNFLIKISKSDTTKIGFQVQLRFQLTQHIRDLELMKRIPDYLSSGNIYINRGAVDFKVIKLQDLNRIVSLFNKYPIAGIKHLDYLDFVKALELLNNKSHLTEEGLNQLLILKDNMNKGRLN